MKKPTLFGKYLLLERVNVGGMAEVFIAKAFGVEGFERILAIKKILPTMAEDEEFITMFIDEARISVQLNHANIVHIHELGKHDEAYFIAMEYVSGRDLRTMLEQYRRRKEIMPTAQAVFVASKICEGLDYAHRKKDARGQDLHIIHRDVSPQNILCSYEGEVKIIDFGIAKAANRSQKTQAGILKGKFGYMSPEQVRGLPIDRRSDVFAVGVILYEMLTGEKLFVGESDFSTLEKVRNADVPAPRQFNPNIPSGLEKVLMKALAREAEDRYQWASDLQEDLMRFLLAGDAIYSAKHLTQFMKEAFAEDLKAEDEKMQRFAGIEKPDQLESSGVLALAPTKRRASVPQAAASEAQRLGRGASGSLPPTAGAVAAIPPPSAAELAEMDQSSDRTVIIGNDARTSLDLKTMPQSGGPAAGQVDPDARTNNALEPVPPVGVTTEPPRRLSGASDTSSNVALRPLDETGLRASPMGPGQDETTANRPPADETAISAPKAKSGAKPKIVIGDAPAYTGATMIGPSPTKPVEASVSGEYSGDGAEAYEDAEGAHKTDARRSSLADEGDVATDGMPEAPKSPGRSAGPVRNARRPTEAAPRVKGPGLAALLSNPRVLLIAGVGALLLVLSAVAVVLLRNTPGRLLVKVDPASVPFNLYVVKDTRDPKTGKLLEKPSVYDGRKPVELDPGRYEVDVVPGPMDYQRKKYQVRITGGQETMQEVKLERVAPEKAPVPAPDPQPAPDAPRPGDPGGYTLVLHCEEAGVEVFIDGRRLGATPTLAKQDPLAFDKPHKLVAKKQGFKTLTLELTNPGKEPTLERMLALEREEAAPKPEVVKKVEPKPEPKPEPVAKVEPKPEPKPEVVKKVEPKPEPKPEPVVKKVEPQPAVNSKAKGRLACNSKPTGAEIWVDGKNTGKKTPLPISSALELSAGKHKVIFKLSGKQSPAQDIVVSDGETAILKNVEIP
ncbi:MAG: protein kinase [Myxococcaceae bacterium]|nr:protein kinase [Myxococcaceae bacterium]